MEIEHRAVYRITPDARDLVAMAMIEDGQEFFADEVIDISSSGACIRFSRDSGCRVKEGQTVRVLLTARTLPEPVELRATVVRTEQRLRAQSYAVSFDVEGLPLDLYRVFNRRAVQRH